MIKGSRDQYILYHVYKANEDEIFTLMEDLCRIDPEQHLSFVLRFIGTQTQPDVSIIIFLLQLNKFQRIFF